MVYFELEEGVRDGIIWGTTTGIKEDIYKSGLAYFELIKLKCAASIIKDKFEAYQQGEHCVDIEKETIDGMRSVLFSLYNETYNFCEVDRHIIRNNCYYSNGISEGTLYFLADEGFAKNSKEWMVAAKKFRRVYAKEYFKTLFSIEKRSMRKNFNEKFLKGAKVAVSQDKIGNLIQKELTRLEKDFQVIVSDETLNKILGGLRKHEKGYIETLSKYVTILKSDRKQWWEIDKIILLELSRKPFGFKTEIFLAFLKGALGGAFLGVILGGIIGPIISLIMGNGIIAGAKWGAAIAGIILIAFVGVGMASTEAKKIWEKHLKAIYDKFYNLRIRDITKDGVLKRFSNWLGG